MLPPAASRFGRTLVVALALGLVTIGSAAAEPSAAVQKKLKGKMYLAEESFVLDGDDDAEVIKNIQKQSKASLAHRAEGENAIWHVAFVAFLGKKPGVTQVSVDFYDGKNTYVANKRMSGVSADIPVLASEFDISEDDGLTRGKPYTVKLSASVKGKDVVFATAKIKLD
jgi:hypothetical protein